MMRRLPGFAAVLLLAGGTLAAPITLGPRYKDESDGFQIQIPRKWDQVPTKFQEVATLGKWGGKPKRGRVAPALYVLRILKPSAVEEPESPADAAARGIPGYAGLLRSQPRDVWEYVERFFYGGFEILDEDEDYGMSDKDLRAHLRVYREKLPAAAQGHRDADKMQRMVVAASIEPVEGGDSSFGVVYACAVADEEYMRRTFELSIRRFRILEPDEEEDVEDGDVSDDDIFVDSTKKPEAWREARKRKLIEGWDAIDTENYLILYNKEVKRSLVKTVAKHIEAIRRDVYEQLFPPAKKVTAISVVRVCKDRQEYHRYGGPGGSAGYWSRAEEELVFYQDRSNKRDSLRTLYHEAFHQYIHYAVGDVAPHSWFNEGHGDYFAGHNYRGGKFVAAPFRWRTGIISNAIARKTYVPLEKFLKYTQGEYYANPGLCYAQGWSLVYFLREAERRKIRRYKKYWGLLDRYFEAIKRNVKSVREEGLGGLREGPYPVPAEPADEPAPAEPEERLPRLPGLEEPFPGEHPEAGAAPPEDGAAPAERRTVAGPRITGTRSALDAAVDEIFFNNPKIDLRELEKDWIEFMK